MSASESTYLFDHARELENFRISLVQLREMLVANGIATAEDIEEAIRLIEGGLWVGLPPMTVAVFAQKPGG